MKNLLIFTVYILLSTLSAAEFKVSLGGKGIIKDQIKFPSKNQDFFIWTSENTFTTNTYLYGSSECSGSTHLRNMGVSNDMENMYIICKGKSIDGFYYISLHEGIKSDWSIGTDKFEYLDGTGPWKELIGAKCTGAFLLMEKNYYLWNAKCDVSDETLKRIEGFAKRN